MITAIAVDDEPLALALIENFCSRVDFIQLQKTFTSPAEAQKHMRKFPVALMFLDVQMPSITGIDFYKGIQQDTMVIFTTAYSEYAVEGFNLSAVDYLLKPYTFERFKQAVDKARDYYNYRHQNKSVADQYLFIRADYSLVKIAIADIAYVEGLDDYLKIHLRNQPVVVVRMTMKSFLEKVPAGQFVRVHRSFIVPFAAIESVRNKTIYLPGKEIPLGNSYEEEFYKVFKP